jgi:thiosulfate dehydrogenase [quinone] large subunit
LSLILGFLARPAIIFGITLLAMYYLSHPPFVGIRYAVPNEGSYLIVNKNLIELIALVVLYVFPSSKHIGVDRFIFKKP